MPAIVAPCGLSCSTCPAYLATRQNDDAARARLAAQYTTPAYPLTPADVNCDGCPAPDERVMSFCRGCDIRRCGQERAVTSCALCDDYPCAKLAKIEPEARAKLAEIRASQRRA
jgi:hypothetical protein